MLVFFFLGGGLPENRVSFWENGFRLISYTAVIKFQRAV
jgi:hypothetical protein